MRVEEGLRFRHEGQAYQVVAYHPPVNFPGGGMVLHSVPIETDEELPTLSGGEKSEGRDSRPV